MAEFSDDQWLGGAEFCLDVSNIHLPVGRSLAGFQLELVGGVSLLGLAALGTFATFTGRGDRSTVCFGVYKAQLGQGRELFLSGFPTGYSADRCVFLLSRSNSSLAAVDASGASVGTTDFAKCCSAGADTVGTELGADSRSCSPYGRYFPFTLPAATLVGF